MAGQKWSAGMTTGGAIGGTDQVVGLHGLVDTIWTWSQAATYIGGAVGLTVGSTSITGGTTTRFLYDLAGVVSETAGLTYTAATSALTLSGPLTVNGGTSSTFAAGTITTSQPFTITQTWNAGGVTFDAVVTNITLTACANPSYFWRGQSAGSDRIQLYVPNASGNASIALLSGTAGRQSVHTAGNSTWQEAAGTPKIYIEASANWITLANDTLFQWTASTATAAADLILKRYAAATLQLGAADAASPVAQTFLVQSVVAGTSNTAGANWTFGGSKGTGTGVGGSLIFQVAPAGSTGTSQNALATALTIDSTNRVNVASVGAAATPSMTVGNSTTGFFSVSTTGFGISVNGVTKLDYGVTQGSKWTSVVEIVSTGGMTVAAASYFQFSARTYFQSPADGNLAIFNQAGNDFGRLQLGGTSDSFGAIARDGAGVKFVGGAGGSVAWVKVPGVTVANLPSAATAGVGALSFVTDASTTLILGLGGTVTGGGANKTPVYSDGTNWIYG